MSDSAHPMPPGAPDAATCPVCGRRALVTDGRFASHVGLSGLFCGGSNLKGLVFPSAPLMPGHEYFDEPVSPSAPRPSEAPARDDPHYLKAFRVGDPVADAMMTLRNAGISSGAACHHDHDKTLSNLHAATTALWRLLEERLNASRGEAGDLMARLQEAEGRVPLASASPATHQDTFAAVLEKHQPGTGKDFRDRFAFIACTCGALITEPLTGDEGLTQQLYERHRRHVAEQLVASLPSPVVAAPQESWHTATCGVWAVMSMGGTPSLRHAACTCGLSAAVDVLAAAPQEQTLPEITWDDNW